jgi:hypothetical protein
MPHYDFKCCSCGAIGRDIILTISALDEKRFTPEKNSTASWGVGEDSLDTSQQDHDGPYFRIECGKCSRSICVQDYSGGPRNYIDGQNSGMYGKYNPGLGCVVDDYGHKQRLLKEQGVREAADPINGSRTILGDSDVIDQHFDAPGAKKREAEERKKRSEGVIWA